MGIYATTAQVRAELADTADLDLPDDDGLERAIARAERRVDLALGPLPRDPTSGLRLAGLLIAMPAGTRAAVVRATAAAVEWELLLEDEEWLAGVGLYLPGELNLAAPPQRTPPRVLEELAGHGLVATRHTVAPEVDVG